MFCHSYHFFFVLLVCSRELNSTFLAESEMQGESVSESVTFPLCSLNVSVLLQQEAGIDSGFSAIRSVHVI